MITWNRDNGSVMCIDGNQYIRETSSDGRERYIKLLFDYEKDAKTDCHPTTGRSKRWGAEEDLCDETFHVKYRVKMQEESVEDATNLKWSGNEGTWNQTGVTRYMSVAEFNSPSCGGTREFDTFKWERPPFRNYTFCTFLENLVIEGDRCYIPEKKSKGTVRYTSDDNYSGTKYTYDTSWEDTGETRTGNVFDSLPFVKSEKHRLIQWEHIDFDYKDPDTYLCEDGKVYEKWVSVSYTDDFGKTFTPYTSETKTGELHDEYNLCGTDTDYILSGNGIVVAESGYAQVTGSGGYIPDYILSTYEDYPGHDNVTANSNNIYGPKDIMASRWKGNFTFEAHFDRGRDYSSETEKMEILNGSAHITDFTYIPQELFNFEKGLYRRTPNHYRRISLEGWKLKGYVAENNIFNTMIQWSQTADIYRLEVDISACDEDFKGKVIEDYEKADSRYTRNVDLKY